MNERKVIEAMSRINSLRLDFSALECAEAWRRLGGQNAVKEWQKRTGFGPETPSLYTSQYQETAREADNRNLRDVLECVDRAALEQITKYNPIKPPEPEKESSIEFFNRVMGGLSKR